MLTDAPPRDRTRSEFLKSDGLVTLNVPDTSRLPEIAKQLESALKAGKTADVRVSCTEFLVEASAFYRVPVCGIRVLEARPLTVREHWTTELFGDYHIEKMFIRLWMRTAIRKDVTSFGTFLNTLCHEFCHHLDYHLFRFGDSWHTRGFFERTATLYHFAKGTPRKKLFWAPLSGDRWRIDWQRTRAGR